MSTEQRRGKRVGRAISVTAASVAVLVAVVIALRPSVVSDLTDSVASDADPTPAAVSVVEDPAPAATVPVSPVAAQLNDGGKYFGVSVDPGSSANASVDRFAAAVGVAPNMQLMFQGFGDGFDSSYVRSVVAAGRLPVLSWEPFDGKRPKEDVYPLKAITSGQYDEYLRAEGAKFAALGSPLVVRFAHEMNGSWYPWGAIVGDNTAADYVAAYRHVHDVVTAAGASNVAWMWSPNLVDSHPEVSLASVYPGDEYVDWVGLSCYVNKAYETYDVRFRTTVAQLDVVAPTRPIVLAETSVGRVADRTDRIDELVSSLMEHPRFIGFVWFEINKEQPWAVYDDPDAATALGTAVAQHHYPAPVARTTG
jgi:hypothetical protein